MPCVHFKMLRMRALLVGLFVLLPQALACSTTTFNSTYEDYPDCAASCLACEDSSYSRNFANNCDYVTGACCTSKYHSVIAETWSCVSTTCGDKVSKEAFSTFVQYCKDKKHELQEADVPQGYDLPESKDDEHKRKPLLSTGSIIGICIGAVTVLIGIIGLILKCRHYRRQKNSPPGNSNDSNNMQLIHQVQPMQLGAMANALGQNNDGTLTYTRNTSTLSLTHGRIKTTEKYEFNMTRTRSSPNFRRVAVVEEID